MRLDVTVDVKHTRDNFKRVNCGITIDTDRLSDRRYRDECCAEVKTGLEERLKELYEIRRPSL